MFHAWGSHVGRMISHWARMQHACSLLVACSQLARGKLESLRASHLLLRRLTLPCSSPLRGNPMHSHHFVPIATACESKPHVCVIPAVIFHFSIQEAKTLFGDHTIHVLDSCGVLIHEVLGHRLSCRRTGRHMWAVKLKHSDCSYSISHSRR